MNITLVDMPNDVLICIIQYIEPTYGFYDTYLYRMEYACPDELLTVYDLVTTCKRFGFLREKSYLVHHMDGDEYCDIFTSVNYLGHMNGPQYWRYPTNWIGYVDDTISVRLNAMRPEINGVQYRYSDFAVDNIFEQLCAEIYTDFKNDIEEYIKDYRRTMHPWFLIADTFPKIVLTCDLETILVKYLGFPRVIELRKKEEEFYREERAL